LLLAEWLAIVDKVPASGWMLECMPTGRAVDNSRPNTGWSVEAKIHVYQPGGWNSRPNTGRSVEEGIHHYHPKGWK
jgi:hypothetical protein